MLKKILILMSLQFLLAFTCSALTFTFSDDDFLNGASWGTMSIETTPSSDTLSVQYDAASLAILGQDNADAQATGFGFSFLSNTVLAVTNPADADFASDRNDLNWIMGDFNGQNFPGVANGDEFDPVINKTDYSFAITEGVANNFSPPGIKGGEWDIFYLQFSGVDFNAELFDLADFIELTGVRFQSLSNDVNGGSLFLAGGGGGGIPPQSVVPEPSTLVLLGAGLIGLAVYRRKKG